MIVVYEGYDFVVDPDIDFLMLRNCYHNGCNCLNCTERVFDGCPIDEVDIDTIMEHGETIIYDRD